MQQKRKKPWADVLAEAWIWQITLEASSESTAVTERQRKDHSRVATPPAGESRVATPPTGESRAAQRPALPATQATSQVNTRSSVKEPDPGHQPSQQKQCGGTRPGLRCPSLPWQVLIGSDSMSLLDFVHSDSKCTGRACAALSSHPRHVTVGSVSTMQSRGCRDGSVVPGCSSSRVFTSDSTSAKGSLHPLQSLSLTSGLLPGPAHRQNLPRPREQRQGSDAAEAKPQSQRLASKDQKKETW